jgi:hypothetical protein
MSAGNKRGGEALTSQASKQINRQQLQLAKTTLIAFPPQGLMNLQTTGTENQSIAITHFGAIAPR